MQDLLKIFQAPGVKIEPPIFGPSFFPVFPFKKKGFL